MKTLILMSSLIIGALHPPFVTAQEYPNQPPSFESLDINNDGEISRDEVNDEKLLQAFFELDQDVSGTLTPDEFPSKQKGGMGKDKHMGPGKKPTFAEFDLNGDGELTRDEIKGPLARDFDRFDLDQSNSLTEDELPAPPGMG